MKKESITPYLSPSMEIIVLECSDIIATSDVFDPGGNVTPPSTPSSGVPSGGYAGDDNILDQW